MKNKETLNYNTFMASYRQAHKYCPNCGGEDHFTTLVGYALNLDAPEDYIDKNRCNCLDCGNVHITHDRTAEPVRTVKFIWNSSFAGTNHKIIVNGKTERIGGAVSEEKEATIEAVILLREKYNITYHVKDVKWEWGGEM